MVFWKPTVDTLPKCVSLAHSAMCRLNFSFLTPMQQIEVVSNTYVVSTGLLAAHPHHAVLMACFAADLQDLCKNDIPGVGRVKVCCVAVELYENSAYCLPSLESCAGKDRDTLWSSDWRPHWTLATIL